MEQRQNGRAADRVANRVVVIGAGIGGLCAAVRLAHAGMDVTVVEAWKRPGGKMRVIDSVAGPVDAGPTVLTMRSVFDAVFAAAGARLEDHLTLIPQPILARHWWPDGSTLDLHADAQACADAVGRFAGKRSYNQFRTFQAQTARLYAAFDEPMMQAARPRLGAIAAAALRSPRIWPDLIPGMTLARSLTRQFSDPRLRQLFGRYATYVGGSPYRSPAVLGLVWQAEARGVWAVKGGMHQLALALEALARKGGAQFRYGVAVDRIVPQWGRVADVGLADGTTLPADHVVFNGDPAALTAGLLGGAARSALPLSASQPRSLAAWVWAFAAQPSGPEMIHHNVFFGSDPRREFPPISAGRMPEDPTLYICAQDRAAGTPAPGPERFEIIMNAPSTATLVSQPHEDQTCRDLTFQRLSSFGLTFDPQPEVTSLTQPSGFAKMFPASMGALYGRSPEAALAALQRPVARTALKGLYIAGGGAHPGAGVPMAALSGRHAAEAILQDRALPST
ncbi:1-hydroxycarotenoid 3,4-desaturase CrtD [Rhodobacter ferrooxidans]|uniref:Phytoene desaturase n=1 Tax=Rhodobacter ferrooxidans TaxID=371731 RepID=C8RYP9_9RHOB|nr:1-hydroxycarotenoid 3,4-desaturase CrtD [Rhodobacter sp. SW2]EEW26237.1 phytoene desaturase [Rhodobacter sp. SW2]